MAIDEREFLTELARRQREQEEKCFAARVERAEKERREREEREALAKQKLAAEISHGSPGYCSAETVDKNPAYEKVASEDGGTYPSTIQHVVRHKEKGTLWSHHYIIREDDSDYGHAGRWTEVEAQTKMLTVYVEKKR